MELLPSIGGALRRAASGDLAVDGDDSPLADKLPPGVDPQLGLEMAEKLLGAVGRMADSRTPVPLDGHPDLATDYVAYGSDAAAIADVLSDPIAEWLIAHPGTIVCLSGEWLLVSRNVRVAGVPAGKGLPSGFLPPAVAADLAVDAVALGRLL